MYLFGDVRTTPEECRDLAIWMSAGLSLAIESRGKAYEADSDSTVYADALTLAAIGKFDNADQAIGVIRRHSPDRFSITDTIAEVIQVEKEIAKRIVRWHLVEQISAREIIEKLLSVQTP